MAKVWIDAAMCTGCGACESVCPVEAITLVDARARIDGDICTGCQICVGVCPTGAIREILVVDIVGQAGPTTGALAPQFATPPARRQPAPLAQPAATVAVVTAAGLALRVLRLLAQGVGRWLLSPGSRGTRLPADRSTTAPSAMRSAAGLVGGSGRRSRQRRRGAR